MNRHPVRSVVTGAAGFIGRALVEYLTQGPGEVVAVDHREMAALGVVSHQRDLSKPGAIDDLLTPDTVLFHLAARASVPASVADPRADFECTLASTFEVLESTRRIGCRLVFPSTASIFDPENDLPLIERAYVRPTSPYGAAKVAGEAYCAAYHRSFGLDVRVARMFSVYGVRMTRFAIHDLIRKIQANPLEISLLGDGSQIRDYLYIDDAVAGLVAIAVDGRPGEDYNLASGIPVTMFELVRYIAELMECPTLRVVPTGHSFAGDVPRWYADISKIRSIGFVPEVGLDEGLRRTIEWCRSHRPL